MLMVISPIDNSSTHRHLVMYVCFHFRQNWPAYDITTCHHMTKCWDKCLASHSDLVIHIRWLAERHTECLAGHSGLVIHIRWLAERHTECLAGHWGLVITSGDLLKDMPNVLLLVIQTLLFTSGDLLNDIPNV